MSEPARQTGTSQDRMLVVDADVHVTDPPEALAPYCAMPWRKSLEMLGNSAKRYLDVQGYSPSLRSLPPMPRGHAPRTVMTAAAMRGELDQLGIDYGILLPDHLLFFATLPNVEYAVALSEAYNRWLVAEWLERGNGLYGAVMACPQDPIRSAEEILRYADTEGVCAVYLPTAGIEPLWGHRRYDPILSACAEADLPVILHSVTVVSPAFPTQLNQFENQFGRSVLGHAFAMMANMVSLMHTGVPARHPNLKIVFTEAGVAWVPSMMWRMDRYHQEMRRTVPFLEERPSDYIKRQMWFATQPLEEPVDPKHLVQTMEHYGGADRTLFASDWPHHDFDHPRGLARLPLTPEQRRKIMGENALELFKLPIPERLSKRESQTA